MFYSQFILAKKGPLGTIWIAAHLERKLRRNQVADTDIGVSVDSILFPEAPIALRLSSHLLLGVVRIYSRKVNYLFHDCSEALLKIKQAFRSTAVDLPPEESTAPYHSITLPETFHLDDFELPDSAFQGDVDHHISTKEQITLQDNLEKTEFSTSKFGLDERFGDGNVSHIRLDLDEDLFLNKDQSAMEHSSIRLPSDHNGTFQQGQSSAGPTDMDLDRNQDEFMDGEKDEDIKTNTDLSSWGGYNIQTPGYNIATPGYNIQTPAYNIQTPDLNEIFFSHGQGSHMEGSSVPATPFPETPYHEAEAHSPETTDCAPPSTPGLMEETAHARVNDASPSVNYEDAPKADNNTVPFLQPCSANVTAAINTASAGENTRNEEGNDNLGDPVQQVSLDGNAEKHLPSFDAPNMNCEVSDMCIDLFGEKNMPAENGVILENASNMVNLNDAFVDSTIGLSGAETTINDEATKNLEFEQTQPQFKETPNINSMPGSATTRDFPEPEKVLLPPGFDFTNRNNEFGQLTMERAVSEMDGSIERSFGLIGQKRPFEDDSLLHFQNSTERVSSRQRVKKTNSDFLPLDNDLLTAILAGKKTPGLGPTPNKSCLLKRQKMTPKTGMNKRKLQLDDAMVLHADVIRQQLINTEDICRLRKKAPCTRAEIWIIEKGPLEDEIFSETLFSGATEELSELQRQTYEIDIFKPLKQLLRDGKCRDIETDVPKVTNEESVCTPYPTTTEEQVCNNVGTPYAYPVDLILINPPQDDPSTEPFFGLDNGNFIPEQQLENNNEQIQPSEVVQTDLDKTDNITDIGQGTCETPLHIPEGTLPDSGSGLIHDEMKDEMDKLFGPTDNPSTEAGCAENVNDLIQGDGGMQEEVSLLHDQHVEKDRNDTSVAEDNSVLQESNAGNFVDMEGMGHYDSVPKECSDYYGGIEGVDTDFLNVDEDVDYHEEAGDDADDVGDVSALDNSGWSSRTRGVARYLKLLFDEETGHGRKTAPIDHLLVGKSRKEASRMFFETLVLTTKDYIHVKQEVPFGFVNVMPGVKLMQSEF